MKKTELTATLSRTVNKVGLHLKKRSPEILIVAGVVGTVASAVMACKATLKVEEIMAESNETIEKVHDARNLDGQPSAKDPDKIIEYSADDQVLYSDRPEVGQALRPLCHSGRSVHHQHHRVPQHHA